MYIFSICENNILVKKNKINCEKIGVDKGESEFY